MSMAGMFGRMRWGAVTAGWMAAALLICSGPASAGIADTRHNLGSGAGAIADRNRADTAEICVFCHTPHGGDTSAPVPLWNKRLSTPGSVAGYTTYDTLNLPSLDGTVATVGSVSLACLSCHDGTQAMDNIINAPGSGGYDVTGGGDGGRAFTWTAATGPRVNAAGQMLNAGGFISNLGTDLSNDHPIGIQYCGGGLTGSGTAVTGTCRDSDFVAPETAVVNGNQVFWIDTGAPGSKQRTDLPLYAGRGAATGPLVECASCHDPHVSQGQAGPSGTGRTAGETFLRISNASSAVCTSCHVK